MDGQVPPDVVAERYSRLVALVDAIALEENQALVGQQAEVLVAEGEGRKDEATHRLSGRARDNRLVHFSPAIPAGRGGDAGSPPRPGDIVTTAVTMAAPHYLIADGAPLAVRRTGAGDAWAAASPAMARTAAVVGATTAIDQPGQPVLLGMPAVGRR